MTTVTCMLDALIVWLTATRHPDLQAALALRQQLPALGVRVAAAWVEAMVDGALLPVEGVR